MNVSYLYNLLIIKSLRLEFSRGKKIQISIGGNDHWRKYEKKNKIDTEWSFRRVR